VISSGLVQFKRTFQLSPIILVGGIAGQTPGALLPILSLTQPGAFSAGITSPGDDVDLDNFFAYFEPVAGGTLIDNEVATYPFANQAVAANAIITQGLRVSLKMISPARNPGGYADKLATFSALQSSLAQHTNLGGTYNVATPAFLYTNCLLTALRDVTGGEGAQTQAIWQWDFYQPLLTLAAAAAAYSASMSKIAAGTESKGDPPALSGGSPNVGTGASVAGPAVVPAATSLGGASASSVQAGLASAPPDGG
jgi:hypothetical protein